MKSRTLIALAIAAGFAMSAQAAGDKSASAGETAAKQNAGAEKMFQALDKNKDGFLSRDEVKGTPHDKDFSALDKNGDGKLTREEHAAAPEHANEKAASSGAQPKSKY